MKPACFYFLLLLIFSFQHINAQQDKENSAILRLGAGVTISKWSLIDKSYSSLPGSGIEWGGSVSALFSKGNSIHSLTVRALTGNLKNELATAIIIKQKIWSADYTNLYPLDCFRSRVRFEAGGSVNILYANREYSGLVNTDESFDLTASLGGAVRASYSFNNILGGFTVSEMLNIPFFSCIRQPPFSTEGSGKSRTDFETFSSLTRLRSILMLNKNLSERGTLCLSYQWDYYKINHSRKIQQAGHLLDITYMISL